MTETTFHVPIGFLEAVLAAQPSEVEYLEKEGQVHAADRLSGVTKISYEPVRIQGEIVPDVVRIVYVHERRQDRSRWFVVNSMKQSKYSPYYLSFAVASEAEARPFLWKLRAPSRISCRHPYGAVGGSRHCTT